VSADRRRALAGLGAFAAAAAQPVLWRAAAGAAGAGALLAGCAATPGAGAPAPAPAPGGGSAAGLSPQEMPPVEPREFRAAWVASVAQIDWPSAAGLPVAQQQAEAMAILDRARAIGLNALILQIRPTADALYRSELEPWSEYLTGQQGRAPDPMWDPLAFWVEGAHRRGLELHAWFNPYRARHPSARGPQAPLHVSQRAPHWVRSYGDMLWMDPGEPEAAAHMLAVVSDVLRRYDIDGVHIDDYFYPYPIPVPGSTATPGNPAPELPFPDDATWARYQAGGGRLSRDDWRRSNVDALVQALYRTVHEVKPGTRVGVSPFGIGRPDRRPPGITGFSQFDKIYADAEKWLQQGWLDYLAPQLYWPIDRVGQQYPVLLDGWMAENTARRHMWPGLFTSLTVDRAAGQPLGPRAWPASELLAQVEVTRSRGPGVPAGTVPALPTGHAALPPGPGAVNGGASGHIHFSMVALMRDRDGLATALREGPYAQAALVPATPWLAPRARPLLPHPAPLLALQDGEVAVRPGAALQAEVAAPWLWAVWRRQQGRWRFAVQPGAQRRLAPEGADALVVSAVDRLGATSLRAALRLA
jgi:uncharacterized lipoprotein YddW (UPF0748 family)